MSIEQDINRIRELLEVLTEVVVEKNFADVEDNYGNNTYCDENCHCAFEDGSDNEATIEFIVVEDSEIINDLNLWLGRQINWSWQNRKNAEANAFELVFEYIQKALKAKQ